MHDPAPPHCSAGLAVPHLQHIWSSSAISAQYLSDAPEGGLSLLPTSFVVACTARQGFAQMQRMTMPGAEGINGQRRGRAVHDGVGRRI